ncbi:hypothetical protein BKH43_07455 [Helicobacter sp. 13S00401-1]|uniref:DUF4411 family protein n=1 Tax=Helicobacter sp. 13S00401-1 TaxID=1905758 RepID=UPI000BA6FF8B|nr:DUF4411 family protein [Helicobacter sp. 13S00401-1]PAF49021.1 hypothetical protein BKH43_07455 [Helicobacter sp. 13S00401-1]
MKYLIDTNIFIESAYRYYRFDICLGFWEWIKDVASNDKSIRSLDKVKEEIKSIDKVGKDKKTNELSRFIASLDKAFFIDKNTIDKEAITKVANAINKDFYQQASKDAFESGADFFLVALALQDRYTIVTHEKELSPNTTKVKIPNIAKELGVECINISDLLVQKDVQFVLKT